MTGFVKEYYASFANRASDLLRELREDIAFDGVAADAAREAATSLEYLLRVLWDEGVLTVEVREPFEE